ncbi:MT-A70-like [Dillenia turbinata]|uniref:MT-A70-like n=1 Tax=Dillenia turbinata TaxID=194707 RepID=A0AAN8VSX6_9MAGN
MAESKTSDKLGEFLVSGIYRFANFNAVFIDPVRVLNRSYSKFKVSPSSYYPRFFHSNNHKTLMPTETTSLSSSSNPRKRKRKPKKNPRPLNERELAAEQRHQELRPLLVKAHEAFLEATDLLSVTHSLWSDDCCSGKCSDSAEVSFVELAKVWQSRLYEISLNPDHQNQPIENSDSSVMDCNQPRVLPLFSNLVANDTKDEVEAEILNCIYVLPRKSSFYMVPNESFQFFWGKLVLCTFVIVAVDADCGFNLIVIDPPWENRSAYQKGMYPTLPNRYLLSLPIKQLTHTKGALVALWVTNREKLRVFIEEELFPAWGVRYMTSFYWLKVEADGSLIGELDLFHHRPYECLLLGYSEGDITNSSFLSNFITLHNNQVIISVPGEYSRKPPVGGEIAIVDGWNDVQGSSILMNQLITYRSDHKPVKAHLCLRLDKHAFFYKTIEEFSKVHPTD